MCSKQKTQQCQLQREASLSGTKGVCMVIKKIAEKYPLNFETLL